MRTTLALDEDVAAALDEFTRRQPGLSFKKAVNELLRTGLYARAHTAKSAPFLVQPRKLVFTSVNIW